MISFRRFLGKIRRFFERGILAVARLVGRGAIRFGPPVGLYRALDGPVNLILADQPLQPSGPESLRVRCGMRQDGRQPWPIFWKRIPRATLVGLSLAELRADKRIMAESVYGYGYDNVSQDPALTYLRLPPAVHLEGPWTSLVSLWCSTRHFNYYHWLLGGLPRLAILDRFPEETRIIIPAPMRSFYEQSLEILGLRDRARPTNETHLLIDDYYFSSLTTMTGCDDPYAIKFLRNRFLGAAAALPDLPEKIYISRQKAPTRAPLDEERMIEFLRNRGWFILEAENYTFTEQIALFSRARAICAVHGAGLTNLLWCQSGCRVLELCAATFLNGCYEGIATHVGLDHRYLVFDADAAGRLRPDFEAFTAAVRRIE